MGDDVDEWMQVLLWILLKRSVTDIISSRMAVIQTKIIYFNLRNQSSAEHFKKKENETKSERQWFFTQLSHILKVIEYYAIVFLQCSVHALNGDCCFACLISIGS